MSATARKPDYSLGAARRRYRKMDTAALFERLAAGAGGEEKGIINAEITRRARDLKEPVAIALAEEKLHMKFVNPPECEEALPGDGTGAENAAPRAAPQAEGGGEEWLGASAAAREMGVSRETLGNWTKKGMPHRWEARIGGRQRVYRLGDVRAWRAEREKKPRATPKPRGPRLSCPYRGDGAGEHEPGEHEVRPDGAADITDERTDLLHHKAGGAYESPAPAPTPPAALSRTDERADLLRRHGQLALALREMPEQHALEERERMLTGELARVRTQLVNVLDATVELKRVEMQMAALGVMGGSA